ncbi:efflux RND transporter periplasmic adaptor subunit [Oligoflexus tunisiensis]|uniref:efflux RND transporter periplasmic adaptor subunit n=1 Tax=Oligoflexus tunisiensis TaxID=708132 RepID=UPI000AAC3F27|nr:efflux RND transporter periplasmic adaptor subunit [Oligoflexus tunisiensis]
MNQAKSKSRLKLWILLGVALLLGGGGWYYYKKKKSLPPVTYTEATVTRDTLQITILSTGIVQPENRLEIKPPIAGRVEQVLVNEGDEVRKGQILAWMSSTERAALLDAARAKGAAEVKRWEDIYRPTPIMAPINGTIILRNVEAGQTFSNVDSVFSMSNRLTIKAQVDETDLAQIKKGQTATVVLDAYPREEIPGKVEKLAYDAKTVNNVTTYTVDVLPNKTPEFMRSGMTANVTFLVSEKKDVLTIPSEAIKFMDGKPAVLRPNPDQSLPPIEQPIKIGVTDGKQTELVEGLEEGATILIENLTLGNGAAAGGNPFMPSRRPRGSRGGR